MRIAWAIAAGFVLSGCGVSIERQLAQQDAECRTWGAPPGTQAYAQCRALVMQRDQAERERKSAVGAQMLGIGSGMMSGH
jgi:hypothetical protein